MSQIITELPSEYVATQTFEDYKKEVNQKLGSVYTVKGSVENFDALEAIQTKNIGDVYNLLDTGANYVYTEDGWDKLSETIDMRNFIDIETFNKLVARVEILENEGGTE